MIEPPFLPLRGKSIVPRPRVFGEAYWRGRGAVVSRARFEHDFRTMYAIRLLEQQAAWFAVYELVLIVLVACGLSDGFAFLTQGHGPGDARAALVFAVAAGLLILGRPSLRRDRCRAARNAFAQLRADALKLDDAQYGADLARLQQTDGLWLWSVLRRPACNAVCRELGCWSDVRRFDMELQDRALTWWHALLGHSRFQARRRLAPVATDVAP